MTTMPFSKSINAKIPIVFWLFFVIASFVYMVGTYQLSSEIPYLDDYDALINFLISVKKETSLIKKIELLFQQHNEHRIVIPRLVVWAQYALTGEVNLRHTIIFGNLMLVGICYILIRFFLQKTLWTISFGSLLLLMNYLHFENYQWALSSLQNFGVLFFSLISIVFVNQNKWRSAFFFSIVAALVGATGMLLIVCYAGYYAMQRKYPVSILYLGTILGFYFLFYSSGYQSTHQHPGFIYVLKNPIQLLQYYFSLVASYTSPFFRDTPVFAIICGIIIWGLNVILTIRILVKDKKNPRVLLSIFLNLILISIAYTRFTFGLDQAFASRYIVYSTILLLLTVHLLFSAVGREKTWAKWVLGTLFVLFCTFHSYRSTIKYQPYVNGVHKHLNNTLCLYRQGKLPELSYIGHHNPYQILQAAERLQILQFTDDSCK